MGETQRHYSRPLAKVSNQNANELQEAEQAQRVPPPLWVQLFHTTPVR